jgi:hypothetical protein
MVNMVMEDKKWYLTLSLKHIKKKIHIFYSLSHTADFYAISHIARFGSGKQSNVILTTQG